MVETFLIDLVNTFGYLGVFLGSLIGSASIFLPVPSFIFTVAAGALLDPLLVGVLAGFGAAIGELVGYGIGYGLHLGHKKLRKGKKYKKDKKWTITIKKWFHRKYGPLVIFIFAITPLPDDIIGIFCGVTKYDVKKFFVATLLGKVILSLILAYVGYYGWEFAIEFF